MQTKYLLYNEPAGLGNYLYFVLQSYIQSTQTCNVLQCVCDQNCMDGVYNRLRQLNLSKFIVPGLNYNFIRIHSNVQHLGQDFTYQQLESFIKQYILKSEIFTNYKMTEEKERCLLLNIRNGDYLLPIWKFLNCFDRKDYLNKAINDPIFEKFEQVHIFSDDLDLCKKEYHQMLAKRFKKIKYITCGTVIDDFVELSHYKYKIIWNSTFSYWSSFVSDIIHNHTGIIATPSLNQETEPGTVVCPSHWKFIPVIKN